MFWFYTDMAKRKLCQGVHSQDAEDDITFFKSGIHIGNYAFRIPLPVPFLMSSFFFRTDGELSLSKEPPHRWCQILWKAWSCVHSVQAQSNWRAFYVCVLGLMVPSPGWVDLLWGCWPALLKFMMVLLSFLWPIS